MSNEPSTSALAPREVSIIVPVFNEEGILWDMAEKLAAHFDEIVGNDQWNFIIVENGSTDRTPKIIEEIVARWPATKPVHLPRSNIGEALRAGLHHCQAPWAHIINIDYWDITFFEWAWKCRNHYDLFLGSKLADPTLYNASGYRRFLSWGLNAILRLNYDFVAADTHGPKLLRMASMRPIVEACVMGRGQFDTEIVLRSFRKGVWIAEAPTFYEELRPPRNLMVRKILQNIWDQFRLYRTISKIAYESPLRFHRYAREDLIDLKLGMPASAGRRESQG